MEIILDKDIYYNTLFGALGCNVRIIKDDDGFFRVYFCNPYNRSILVGFAERYLTGYANYVKTNYLKSIPNRRIQWIDFLVRGSCKKSIGANTHIHFKVRNNHITECFWGREFVKKSISEYYLFELKVRCFEYESILRDSYSRYKSQIKFFLRRTFK